MDNEDRDQLEDIVDKINRDVEMPPYNNSSSKHGYSREYLDYKKEEMDESENTRYEDLCLKAGKLLNLKPDENTVKKLSPPLKLLDWDITPGMVLSAALLVGLSGFTTWFVLFMLNMLVPGGPILPNSIMLILLTIPLGAGLYTYYVPVYAAKNKVIRSSGEMILSILYMVVYMRSSPNLEGALRFAALNLDGPISKDLKGVLWDLEVGNYARISESLESYTRSWKGYNDDFLESLQLLKAAMNEPNGDRRETMLQDAIDTILDGTKERMKHYAQSLKTPVMILNAMGAMLPVLAMILLPLVSVFMGDVVTPIHLIVTFNLLLPGFLYWFMQRILSSRPPTVNSDPVSQDSLPTRGTYQIERGGKKFGIPVWPIGAGIFLLLGIYGIIGYLLFPSFYPVSNINPADVPAIFLSNGSLSPFPMLMRSVSLTLGLGLGIGVAKVLGNTNRKQAEEHLGMIESQFPTALFQLGNKISGGTPIELALQEAAEATNDMEISGLFQKASINVRNMGMTFEDALFDPSYGAIQQYPSQMIHTVMKAILESSEKGTKMASLAMLTISRYLKNIHKTQETLNDLMEDITTTIQMLAYLLAPIVSGVAVGMSQTIITSMYELSESFQDSGASLPGGSASGSSTAGFGGILGNLDGAISPEVLQLVVGIYLIQLLWILGTFYMKIMEGENPTYRNMFVGKVLISGMLFYSMTVVIISRLFGGMVSGVTG